MGHGVCSHQFAASGHHRRIPGGTDLATSRSQLGGGHLNPLQWRGFEASTGVIDFGPHHLDRAIIQQWTGSDAEMRQPALDHHLFVLHQGGPKRVVRKGAGQTRDEIVALNSCTTVESGSSYHWNTEGPIAFAHIYVRPDRFGEMVGEAFNRDPANVRLAERIGQYDPLTANLFNAVLAARDQPDWSALAEPYLDALIVRLASLATQGGSFVPPPRLTLAPHTVRRVREYIMANLANRITLDDLAMVAGYSRYHFVRAFRISAGYPPYAYLIRQRIEHACALLAGGDLPIAEVAVQSGFSSHAQFSTRFREVMGISPVEYRRHRGWRAPVPGDPAADVAPDDQKP